MSSCQYCSKTLTGKQVKFCSRIHCAAFNTTKRVKELKDDPRFKAQIAARSRRYNQSERGRAKRLERDRQSLRKVRRSGWTPEEYMAAMEHQHGLCALCHRPGRELRRLHADHSHITGQPRALLCSACNGMVGRLETYE